MQITSEWLHTHATRGCGWTKAQLRILGVTSQRKGWLSALVGIEITEAQRAAFEQAGADRARVLAKRILQAGVGVCEIHERAVGAIRQRAPGRRPRTHAVGDPVS